MKRGILQSIIYLLTDFIGSCLVWVAYAYLRDDEPHNFDFFKHLLWLSGALVSMGWVLLYGIAGLYAKPFRRSRLQEIIQVFKFTFLGVLALFFAIFLDDYNLNESHLPRRTLLILYMGMQFGGIAFIRFLITSRTNIRIRKGKIGYPTLIIGSRDQAFTIYQELTSMRRSLGYQFKGYISLDQGENSLLKGKLRHCGGLDRLEEVVRKRKIEELIIALEEDEADQIGQVISMSERTNAYIKVVPGIYDYIIGSAKVSHILGEPLIEIFPSIMRPWERSVKRMIDILGASSALIVLTPVFLAFGIWIKLDSQGPVFFRQERIGKRGKPFWIVKFRTMRIDAEKAGPALSSDHDPRITRAGRFLRRSRLDELPQFWNVLKGEMSIVGPRPERQFYIDQIIQFSPHYLHLHKVRPGITSWGQVKYGYASNVEEMLERLKFDILYIENMSLALDLKIILYTLIVIIEGRGK